MSPDLSRIIRPHVLNLKPYSSARDEFTGEAEVFLDANENAFGSVTHAVFNRYPDPLQKAVKEKLAVVKGVSPDQIFLGNGSDEAIDLLVRACCDPARDHVLLLPPTYGMYQVSADIAAVKTVLAPLRPDFQIDLPETISLLRPGTKLVFICSPNNPSGNAMDPAHIRQVLQHAPGLVVLDEAYIDFAPEKSFLPLLAEFPNLVILQTFSKAWGLAALRIGMAFAHPNLIAVLNRIKAPYNLNAVTQQLALEALERVEEKNRMVTGVLEEREKLVAALSELPLVQQVFPSDANFLLVKFPEPDRIYQYLMEQGIIVRNRSKVLHCAGCLRITVGTVEENEKLLEKLKAFGNS
ncbi:MAG: histidinol-phosphate transaminase [Bacteroidetes bacterium]|nr:MAG: histidinol-phosphate transaminase [Bacteroidota bacterium]